MSWLDRAPRPVSSYLGIPRICSKTHRTRAIRLAGPVDNRRGTVSKSGILSSNREESSFVALQNRSYNHSTWRVVVVSAECTQTRACVGPLMTGLLRERRYVVP